MPTVREAGRSRDELAQHASERRGTERCAPCLYQALVERAGAWRRSRCKGDARQQRSTIRAQLAAYREPTAIVKLEYFEIVDPETMQPVDDVDRSGPRCRCDVGRKDAVDRQRSREAET